MISLTPAEQALVDASFKRVHWLFEVTNDSTTYYWSFAEVTYNLQAYTATVIPDSFSGVLLQRARSEFGIQAPGELRFAIPNANNTLSATDFVGAKVVCRLVLADAAGNQEQINSWRHTVKQCDPAYQRLTFTCPDFLASKLEGFWPNTPLLSELAPEATGSDGMCVPVPFGTAYVPLRSLYLTDARYYLLGPADGVTYTISKVRSPRAWGSVSTWESPAYAMTQSTKIIDGANYRVFQPIIADSNSDGVADACGLWRQGDRFLDMPCQFSRSDTASLTNPADVLQWILEDMGFLPAEINSASFTAAAATFTSWGLTWEGAFLSPQPRRQVIADLLNQCHSVLDVGETISLRVLSKTSQKDVTKASVQNRQDSGEGSWKVRSVTQEDSDSGYAAYQESDEPTDQLIRILVPAGPTSDSPASTTLPMPLVHNAIHVQNLAHLAYQRRFNRASTITWDAPSTFLALQPDDVVTSVPADYGASVPLLIDQLRIQRDLTLSVSAVKFYYPLSDWGDLAFTGVTPASDDSSAIWQPALTGPESTSSTGSVPNVLPGRLRIGETAAHIVLDPADGINVFGFEQTAHIGIDGSSWFGTASVKSLAVSTAGVVTVAGFTATDTRLTAATEANFGVDSSAKRLWLNSETYGQTGIQLEYNSGTPRFFVGNPAANYAKHDGTNFTFVGNTTSLDASGLFTATNAAISGQITAATGTIGGFTLASNSLTSTNIGLHSGVNAMILLGHATDYAQAAIGFKNDGSGKLANGNLFWDAAGLANFSGNAYVLNPFAFTFSDDFSGDTLSLVKWVKEGAFTETINNGFSATRAVAGWTATIHTEDNYPQESEAVVEYDVEALATFCRVMVGFRKSTASGGSYTQLSHAVYIGTGVIAIYESGTQLYVFADSAYAVGDIFRIRIALTSVGATYQIFKNGNYLTPAHEYIGATLRAPSHHIGVSWYDLDARFIIRRVGVNKGLGQYGAISAAMVKTGLLQSANYNPGSAGVAFDLDNAKLHVYEAAGLEVYSSGGVNIRNGGDITLEGSNSLGDKAVINFGDDIHMGASLDGAAASIWNTGVNPATGVGAFGDFSIGAEIEVNGCVGGPCLKVYTLKPFQRVSTYATVETLLQVSPESSYNSWAQLLLGTTTSSLSYLQRVAGLKSRNSDGVSVWSEIAAYTSCGSGATPSPHFTVDAQTQTFGSRVALLDIDGVTGYCGLGVKGPQRPLHILSAAPYIRMETDLGGVAEIGANDGGDLLLAPTRRVGIGTTGPATLLHVNSGTSLEGFRLESSVNTLLTLYTSGNRGVYIQNAGTGGALLAAEYGPLRLYTGTGGSSTEKARITATGNVLIATTTDNTVGKLQVSGDITGTARLLLNETTNSNQTIGITINQGTSTTEIFSLKSSATAHGRTSLTETDTYAHMGPIVPASGAGLLIRSFTGAAVGMKLQTVVGTQIGTKTGAPVELIASLGSGTGTTTIGDANNLVCIKNDATVRWVVTGNGEVYSDYSTAMTLYDDEQDALACRDMAYAIAGPEWSDKILSYHRPKLVDMGVMTADGFVARRKMDALLLGGIGEMWGVLDRALARLGMSYDQLRKEYREAI